MFALSWPCSVCPAVIPGASRVHLPNKPSGLLPAKETFLSVSPHQDWRPLLTLRPVTKCEPFLCFAVMLLHIVCLKEATRCS